MRSPASAGSSTEDSMSYQAQTFVSNLRGITRCEKGLLNALAWYHRNDNGTCHVTLDELATDAVMHKRHVIRLLQSLESRDVIRRIRARFGHNVTGYIFVGLKGDTMSPLPISREARRGDIPCNREVTSDAS